MKQGQNSNMERFTGRVAAYARYRMRYPAGVLDWLREVCGLTPEWRVADIGAGTGMLAELFLEHGNPVVAVEPNAEMRAECEVLCQRYPGLRVVDGAAEGTGLEGASVDLVTVGRAFHWFDPVPAVKEFERIARGAGWVALVACGRSKEGSAQVEAYEELLHRFGTDYGKVRSGHRVHERLEDVFGGRAVHHHELQGEERIGREQFLGEAMTLSVMPLPGSDGYEAALEALREYFAEHAVDGVLTVKTSCWMNAIALHG